MTVEFVDVDQRSRNNSFNIVDATDNYFKFKCVKKIKKALLTNVDFVDSRLTVSKISKN